MLWQLLRRVPAWCWLVVAGLLLIGGMEARMRILESQVVESAFAKDSVEAFNAHTVLKISGMRKIASRRAIQTDMLRDSLNKANNTIARMRSNSSVAVDEQSGHVEVATVPVLEFHQYKMPYDLSATVKSQADGTSSLDWTVKQDPFRIGARIDCGEADEHGVHAAYLTLDLPKYMTATVDSVSQSKDVCSPRAAALDMHGISRTRAYTEAGILLGGILVVRKFILPLFKR